MPTFSERQFFARWVFLLVGSSSLFPLILVSVVPIKPADAAIVWPIMSGLFFMPILLFGTLGVMYTEVQTDELLVAFGYFRLIKYRFRLSEIDSIEVRKYDPLMEFGGWGIRGFGKRRALNMRGNMGVELHLQRKGSPATMMIGSQRAEDLARALADRGVAMLHLPTPPISKLS